MNNKTNEVDEIRQLVRLAAINHGRHQGGNESRDRWPRSGNDSSKRESRLK